MNIRRLYYRLRLALIYDSFCNSLSSCRLCPLDDICEEMYTLYPEDTYKEIKNSLRQLIKLARKAMLDTLKLL